ncbi:sulfatase-like hydrolase/transferase [Paraurantiacibacter namhicola]|uniref:Sulfatase N-terminal domain-containing protein n=1 Tax=Paraurantiacibacter namhicola TaxID=645517 RepID=A0A1C7D557_9SPHN|nr:sulfatase-like hydrolase/transferase [Paraurantiacibacter namhicola]ANU06492.1 hypothetical protein A6F65_00165 [Paraurantiacibacter namhicola]
MNDAETMQRRLPLWRVLLALALFAAGYAVANRYQLTHGVLYRWAAGDMASAAANFGWLALQGAALLAALWLLPTRWMTAALALAFVSVLVNLGFGMTVADTLDAGKLAWLLAETRQAGPAMGEFFGPLVLALAQAVVATGLFWAARKVLAPRKGALALGLFALALPTLLGLIWLPAAGAAERNVYSLALRVAAAEPPPARAAVSIAPDTAGTPRHVVWIVDESIAYDPFARLIAPRLAALQPVDFGRAWAMGNCSAPANVALRSGVAVDRAGPEMDLRATPSIWAYAKKAGYRTLLVEAQVDGPPQNLLLLPELALVDETLNMAGDMDTDRRVAGWLNGQLKSGERSFTFVVLRGVHFQYRDHFPVGTVPTDAPPAEQYRAALTYSKRDFFETLLEGVDRADVAIAYTSDHGQNIAPDTLPHCSRDGVRTEYEVPLLAFLSPERSAVYDDSPREGHSLSQLFPETLVWMGYDRTAAEAAYDNGLTRGPRRYVRFGRGVVPLGAGDRVEVTVSETPEF